MHSSHFQTLWPGGFFYIKDMTFLSDVPLSNQKKLCAVTQIPVGAHNVCRIQIHNNKQGKKSKTVWISHSGMAILKLSGINVRNQSFLKQLYMARTIQI